LSKWSPSIAIKMATMVVVAFLLSLLIYFLLPQLVAKKKVHEQPVAGQVAPDDSSGS
jgi:competence protein ComGC